MNNEETHSGMFLDVSGVFLLLSLIVSLCWLGIASCNDYKETKNRLKELENWKQEQNK